ncbi:twin-arginine translocation signal domain-containing protein [Nocardia arthritidis]|uniref:twin-arginine translocation signal domain-containing protein n=1 Tax=Nocardia arthritidis TaxID=228602 RepID=UPI003D160DD0
MIGDSVEKISTSGTRLILMTLRFAMVRLSPARISRRSVMAGGAATAGTAVIGSFLPSYRIRGW